jgi:hypothetical protein
VNYLVKSNRFSKQVIYIIHIQYINTSTATTTTNTNTDAPSILISLLINILSVTKQQVTVPTKTEILSDVLSNSKNNSIVLSLLLEF